MRIIEGGIKCVLPRLNFWEDFRKYIKHEGRVEILRVSLRGCLGCNMTCDMFMESEDKAPRPYYENVSFSPDSLLEYSDLVHAIHEVDIISL